MKILVTGSQGLLGYEVGIVCEGQGDTVFRTDIVPPSLHLDITDLASIRSILLTMKPNWVINCAAYADVDGCETNQDMAFELNAKAPGNLARACEEFGAKLLHISTDYVFDGCKEDLYTEGDETGPTSIYGKSKRAGEIAVLEGMEHYSIVRTQWLFGPHGKNFVSTILGIAKDRDKITVVNDQWGSPTYSKDLAKAVRLLIDCDAQGIYHVCNRGKATWYDLARKAVELVGMPTEVVPVSTSEYPRPAKRPANSILSTKRFTEVTGKLMPAWQISLDKYIKEFLMEYRRSSPV